MCTCWKVADYFCSHSCEIFAAVSHSYNLLPAYAGPFSLHFVVSLTTENFESFTYINIFQKELFQLRKKFERDSSSINIFMGTF